MLRVLDELYRSRGMVRPGLLRLDDELPSSGAYSRQFGLLDQAFQNLFDGERGKARENVHEQIRGHIPEVTVSLGLPGARPEADRFDPAGGADPHVRITSPARC